MVKYSSSVNKIFDISNRIYTWYKVLNIAIGKLQKLQDTLGYLLIVIAYNSIVP